MSDGDVRALNLDVYDTREGLWNPEHGSVDLPEGWEFLPAGDTFVTRRVNAAGTVAATRAEPSASPQARPVGTDGCGRGRPW